MASDESGHSSNPGTEKQGLVASVVSSSYQAATSALTVWGLFGYKQGEETSDKTPGGDMAKQTGAVVPEVSSDRFTTKDAEDDFQVVDHVDVKGDNGKVSNIDSDEEDGNTALETALKEKDELRSKQTGYLRKINELEKKVKQKDSELKALQQQASSALRKSTLRPSATVDSQSDKEKDRQIRSLQRQLEHAQHLETRVTQLTIELSQKDEEIDQLKKTKKGGVKGQVQEPVSQHRIQELSAEVHKWQEHSKKQSRQVLLLRQELDGQKIEFEERIQSMEGLQEELEGEKKQLFDQARALRAERDELQRTKGQLEKENLVMKQQEVRTMQKSQLLEAQLDETNCPKHGCKEFRKKYSTLAAENAQLQQSLTSLSEISEQLSSREVTVGDQKRIIANLMEKVEIAQTQALSNKADFEEERKDRMEAHSKFADLETLAAKTKSHFDQERAAYEQHVLNLQQDLSAVKAQLKSHAQELAHMEEYSKRQGKLINELTEKKNKLEKELAKRKEPKAGKVVDPTYKQIMIENDRLKAQLSEAKKSVTVMSEAMKNKKGIKKKVSEEVTKRLKRLVAKASGETMECKLTEAQTLIEMLCRTNDELEEKLHALTVANDEMTKMVSNTVPKITKQRSFDRSHNYTEGSQPSSLSVSGEMCSSFPDAYNEGRSRTEEYTTGTGRTATGPKQASMTTSGHFPSTFATQEDQLSPLPPSGAHPSTGVRNLKSEYRRSSDPAVNTGVNFPSSQNQPQTSSSSANDKSHLSALGAQPPMQRIHSNPGPQGSGNTGTRELPVRGSAPPPSVKTQSDLVSQKQPLRAVGPAPPSVSNQGVPNIHQPSPLAGQGHQQTDTTVPQLAVQQQQQQQQQYGNQLTTLGMKLPPKMHSAEVQRREQQQNVDPRPVHSQPQQQQQPRNQQQFGQSSNLQIQNVKNPHGGYHQGTHGPGQQQLQAPQGRPPHPHSDRQEYRTPGEPDVSHRPDSHTPHSHPLPRQHSSGQASPPTAKPGPSLPRARSTQDEYQHSARYQPGGTGSPQSPQPPPSGSKHPTYVNFETLNKPETGLPPHQQPTVPPSSTSTGQGGTSVPTAPKSTRVPVPKDQTQMSSQAVPRLHERRSSGNLLSNIDDDIEDVAAEVRDEVRSGRERTVTNTDRPYDPNLVCPMCNKAFRIGEIQKFRAHVNQCEGKKDGKRPKVQAGGSSGGGHHEAWSDV